MASSATAAFDPDCFRCSLSLRSELGIIETLLQLSDVCLCPTLKTYTFDLYTRKKKLMTELESRREEDAYRSALARKRRRSRLV